VGVAAFIDETVFHQLLHWHHFYDKSTAEIGLVSDGFFHAGGWLAMVVGLFLFADLQRRRATVPKRVGAGALIGWGGFQLYDGVIQHKVFRLHQIRYDVELLPCDIACNAAGGLLLFGGLVWTLPVLALVIALAALAATFLRWRRQPVLHASEADKRLVEQAREGR